MVSRASLLRLALVLEKQPRVQTKVLCVSKPRSSSRRARCSRAAELCWAKVPGRGLESVSSEPGSGVCHRALVPRAASPASVSFWEENRLWVPYLCSNFFKSHRLLWDCNPTWSIKPKRGLSWGFSKENKILESKRKPRACPVKWNTSDVGFECWLNILHF